MKKKFKNPILDCRGELFGLSALMIVFHHLGNRGIPGLSALPSFLGGPLDFISAKASIGVDIFVFLSAIGLYYSMERNTVSQFFRNRFRRVAIPWLVIMIPVFLVEDILLCKEGLIEILLDITTLRYWVDNDNTHTPWFVPFIVAVYIIFPLIYKAHIKTKRISTYGLFLASILFNVVCNIYPNYIYSEFTVCFARLPIFLLGVLLAELLKSDKSVLKKPSLFSTLFIASAVYVGWYFFSPSMGIDLMVGSVVAVGIIVFYAYIVKPIVCSKLTKLFVFIGTVSLEVYLIHTVVLRVLDSSQLSDILFASQYILLPVGLILLAKGVNWITDRIIGFMDSRNIKEKQTIRTE